MALINNVNIISTIFGRTLFVQSISDTSRKILNMIENIFGCNYNNIELDNVFIETDIEATLKTLDTLVLEIKGNDKQLSNTISTAFNNLNNIILEIEQLICTINKILQKHDQRYFYFLFSVNINRELIQLRIKSIILDKRLELLIKMVQII